MDAPTAVINTKPENSIFFQFRDCLFRFSEFGNSNGLSQYLVARYDECSASQTKIRKYV